MSYCTIEEAWGNNLKDSRKKKKTRRLYTTRLEDAVYNRSHMNGSLDPHCKKKNPKNYRIKNKDRHNFSRNGKDIFRPKRSSRSGNIEYSLNNAKDEYKKYKKETKKATRNEISQQDLIDNSEMNRGINSNYDSSTYEDELTNFGNQSYHNIHQENDFDLDTLPSGTDYSSDYYVDDSESIQNQMYKLQEEQNRDKEKQQEKLQQQLLRQGMTNNMRTNDYNSYNSSGNDSEGENYTLANTFYDGIEGFENNALDMDNMSLEHFSEDERLDQIKDVEVEGPKYSDSDNNENTDEETKKNTKKNSKRSNNFLDNLLRNVGLNNNVESDNIDSDNSDSDSEDEDSNRVNVKDEKLKYVNENSKDIDYRLNTLNRNVNLIIKKMNQSQFFDDESQDNIHDLILFILFGIFIIFVLDTIYRFGKKSGHTNY